MKVALASIKTTSPRVRQSQDPEKLDELAASIEALGGVIIPVGVRQNGKGFDLIYGHRRVAAAKMAGLKEIDAIEVNVTDDMARVYALTENVIREGMQDGDIALALQTIMTDNNWTQEKVGRFFGRNQDWVGGLLALLDGELGLSTSGKYERARISARDLEKAKAGLGTDPANRALLPDVLKKVVDEKLTSDQGRHVAELAKRAGEFGGKAAVRRLLSVPYEDLRDTSPPLEPSLGIRSQARKATKKQDWKALSTIIDHAISAINATLPKLLASKEGKAVIRALLPKWIKTLKHLLKTLEEA